MPDFKGKLARNITRDDLEEIAPSAESLDEAMAELEAERLGLLLVHYQISPDLEHLWLRLARALARDFVPGFKRSSRGRPQTNALRQPAIHSLFRKPARRPGAPRKFTPEFYADLVSLVDQIKQEEPTIRKDKEALTMLVDEMAESELSQFKAMARKNRRTLKQEKEYQVGYWQRVLSRAKKSQN